MSNPIYGATLCTPISPQKMGDELKNVIEAVLAQAKAGVVHIGTEEPTDPNVSIWIDISGETNVVDVSIEGA